MSTKSLEEVGLALAEGYPSKDIDTTGKELARVVEVALPSLATRASSALREGKKEVEDIWKAIREDSEGVFASALGEVDRVKVIYVASKFANNELIGHLITGLAMDQARSKKEE